MRVLGQDLSNGINITHQPFVILFMYIVRAEDVAVVRTSGVESPHWIAPPSLEFGLCVCSI